MPRRVLELLAVAAICAAAVTLWPRSSAAPTPYYADPVRTPGVLNPEVTQATIGSTICVRGWTRTIRPPTEYTNDLKRRQMREYGVGGSLRDYQEDHFISLGLGGHPTDPRNLWPQPRPWADDVDDVERDLIRAVCDGELTLEQAQLREAALKHGAG